MKTQSNRADGAWVWIYVLVTLRCVCACVCVGKTTANSHQKNLHSSADLEGLGNFFVVLVVKCNCICNSEVAYTVF